MADKELTTITCPEGDEDCFGLAVSSTGSGIELQQNPKGYVACTRDGEEFFGNCPNYEQCHRKYVLTGRELRVGATN